MQLPCDRTWPPRRPDVALPVWGEAMAPAERARRFARIREEFERLLELADAERASELDRLGRDDAPLAREVAALLAADAAASALLDGTLERFLGLLARGDDESAASAAPSRRGGPR